MAADQTAPEALVRADGVDLSIGRTQILSHVDMTVGRGEIVTLVGPNGAGKSSLVRVILGLVAPSAGEVWRKPGLRVGYLPQKMSIDPVLPITVRRLLALAGPGSSGKTQAVLKEVGADNLADRALQDLSGGEFQRVMLARALLRDPDLLVLDEPLRGIDLGGQLALYDLIGRLRRDRGIGVLMISHDLHIVMAATDRVICLNQHICCSGAPEAVSRSPEYAALFGAAAARQLAVYAHEHDHAHDLHGHVVENANAAAGRP
jgi:zinc transport system ATP-binding protein